VIVGVLAAVVLGEAGMAVLGGLLLLLYWAAGW
jgi:hypothetical protein